MEQPDSTNQPRAKLIIKRCQPRNSTVSLINVVVSGDTVVKGVEGGLWVSCIVHRGRFRGRE